VLLVDDEFSIVETLAEILAFEGYEVVTASDGRRGLEQFRAAPTDAVVVDYMMPAMNGVQLCHELRALPGASQVPIVLITAVAVERLPEPRSWTAALQKPFEAERLLDLLAGLLR
jgi:DNA-binding response OmpR family regulator